MTSSRHSSIRTLLIALPLLLVASCGDDVLVGPQLSELTRAEALWKSHGTGSYTMEQQRSCFCANTDSYRLTIVDEKVVSGINVTTSAPLPESELSYYQSVAQLFAMIRSTLASTSGATVSATYDAGAGYPTSAAFDPLPHAVDDEITYITAKVATRLD